MAYLAKVECQTEIDIQVEIVVRDTDSEAFDRRRQFGRDGIGSDEQSDARETEVYDCSPCRTESGYSVAGGKSEPFDRLYVKGETALGMGVRPLDFRR